MKERLKLKRGLSEISPLFTKTSRLSDSMVVHEPDSVLPPSSLLGQPEIVFSWSVDDEADAHFLNNYFASKLVSPHSPGLLITVGTERKQTESVPKSEPWNDSLRRLCVPASQINEAFSSKLMTYDGALSFEFGNRIFLEMKMNVLLKSPDLIKSLDRVVLFMHPQVESITETYRKLKKMAACGLSADISIVFDADDAAGLSARVYELFSDFVSKRLSLNSNYLGTLHLSRGGAGLSQDLRWTNWGAGSLFRKMNLEKLRFLSWVEKKQGAQICP
ncbi:MAG TPA: hypothetical protein PLY88_06260 [Candidatus Omnitrophota bacterium]|nr:hypothetical protein [Candidatus Omnitrophota bacterium]